ncbi:tRNA dimethylallyltransferase [Leeuwenhoekiella aestuarii]|uniref:tRNA dimethylallyltransferase n=1 Tax=Leeuwenhoekiella aestuarii TaxID=2249426 RepID=A0A4V1KPG8_9FLAO|nr:tRNA (adenosine(37)-N6)-dimethylallyltransferase MiaA [Leeuwenhoekiella aestuarii]RXG15503.1 tRNA dimethylallyltransferase [Leeuwenhoekiella aestuarii]RXG17390.1 tRNA dimethylallyltransferase [Leeuwenhoekiella aestuarii]
MNKTLIAVVGPTAIGKTVLGIKLAKQFNTEIISADSRQFFKEMKIGTAVPNNEELAAAKHHFIQHISIEKEYNVGLFEKEAISKLDDLFKVHDVVIMVGGSGLYVDAVLNGLDRFPDVNSQIREDLILQVENNGIESLQNLLKDLDPIHYNKIDLDNKQRLIRALEICIGTGNPYSSYLAKNTVKRNFNFIKIGLTAERQLIYDRINLRVDLMMQNGLLEEVRYLQHKKHLNALQTVGYRELFSYFDGVYDLKTAIEEIKKNTRRFAKRQLTWYRKDESIIWFDHEIPSQEIITTIKERVSF